MAPKAKKSITKKSAATSKAKKGSGTRAATRDKRRDAPLQQPPEGSKLAREIAALAKLGKTELWKKYKAVFGHDTGSCNTTHLRNVIARKLVEQANDKGGPAKKTAGNVESGSVVESTEAASPTSNRTRDPRLPAVGTVLEREHNGKLHKVRVIEDGFDYQGKTYRSLSGLAKEITGAIWNGWVWFGLVKRPESKKGASDAA